MITAVALCCAWHQQELSSAATERKVMLTAGVQHNCVIVLLGAYRMRKRLYRVSQEERTKLRESVPYVKLYRYNPKHLYPKLNGYGDNGQRSLKL